MRLSGIYLWSVRPGKAFADEHVVYIGRTSSLARRVREYLREFQPHSVNDFKLRVFQERVLATSPSAVFALYFKQLAPELCASAEREAISHFEPLLNQRLSTSPDVQHTFREAFVAYYAAGFVPFLPKNGDA